MGSKKRISRGEKLRQLKSKVFLHNLESSVLLESHYKIFEYMSRKPLKIFLAKYFSWLGFRIDPKKISEEVSKEFRQQVSNHQPDNTEEK